MISLLNANLTGLWIALAIIAVIAVVVVLWFISTYNGFVKLKVNVEEGYSTMDVYLKKRYDLIPNLVETVKGYAKHEKETLQNVIAARNSAMNATSVKEKAQAETELTQSLKTIFALTESYPDLKANKNFESLQQQLQQVEQDIANARKYYNATVKMLNVKVQSFPSNIVANMFKFTTKDMFEVTNANERENVKVEF